MANDYFALVDINLAAECNKKIKFEFLKAPSKFTFRIEAVLGEELLDKVENDVEFQGEVEKLRDKLLQSARARYVKALSEAENEASQLEKPTEQALEKIAKDGDKEIDEELVNLNTIAQGQLDKIVKQWLQDRKERKAYVVKCVRKVVSASIGIVTGSIGVASSVTGNVAGLVLGIIALVKSIANLAKEVINLAKDLDTAESDLKKTLEKAVKTAAKDSSTKIAAKEVAAAITAKLFFFKPATIKDCKGDYDLFIGKLRGVQVKLSDYSSKLNEMLEKQTELNTTINVKIAKELSDRGYKSKRLPGLQKKLEKLEKSTALQIATIEKMYARIEVGKKNDKAYAELVKEMEKLTPTWFGKFEKALLLVDIGLAFAGGELDASGWSTLAVDTANEVKEWVAEELEA